MQKFHLCSDCHARFKESALLSTTHDVSKCYICEGALSRLPGLVKSALQSAKEYGWETFAISSSFKKSVLMREQTVADYFLPTDFTSIKNSANAQLISSVAKETGKKNDGRTPDISLEFNFIEGKTKAKPSNIYVFGHYLKFSRKYCQSRWHCSECGGKGCNSCGGSGQNYPSVEDDLGKVLQAAFSATEYSLHASGREDVDVRALGTGRPFVMELRNPKKRNADLHEIEKKMSHNQNVRAVGLRYVHKHFIPCVCESHFEKEYSALVSADRPLTLSDAEKIETLSGVTLHQQTPTRVLARRTDMNRKRKIFTIHAKIEPHGKLRLFILAEAGTYIKELIHSDEGRTKPSIAALLSCKAACDELDVISIHDSFLTTIAD